MIPIVLPMYARPEFLRETLRALAQCKLIEECKVFGFLDRHDDASIRSACVKLFESFKACPTELDQFSSRLENYAIPEGMKRTVDKTKCEWFIVLEDDIVVADTFLVFMKTICERFIDDPKVFQVTGDQEWSFAQPDITKLRAVPWPSTFGVAYFTKKMDWFFENFPKFMKDPNSFGLSVVSPLPNGNRWKRALVTANGIYANCGWDGFVPLPMIKSNYVTVYPYSHAQACSVGFYGWHAVDDKANNRKSGDFSHPRSPLLFNEHYEPFTLDLEHIEDFDNFKT